MTERSVWYQIRPNKFVDRRIFMDFLCRYTNLEKDRRYFYASMGASHLVDHNQFYRLTGINRLYSFDGDEALIPRQIVNRPIGTTICERLMSNELPERLQSLYDSFIDATNSIIWLDFTTVDRFQQLQELVELLKLSRSGDVIRITMNSHPGNLGGISDYQARGHATPGHLRAEQAQANLGEFFEAKFDRVTSTNFPKVLSHAVKLAIAKAQDELWLGDAAAGLLTTYQDGQRMFTATLLIHDAASPQPALREWEFWPADWDDVLEINVPELSAKEKFVLDQHLGEDPDQIIERVNFLPGEDMDSAMQNLASYKKLHRFVPAFQHVDFA